MIRAVIVWGSTNGVSEGGSERWREVHEVTSVPYRAESCFALAPGAWRLAM